jgi:hypothetical protein
MKTEHDFSKGERGKFYDPAAVFNFPVYLEPDVDDFMSKLADEQDISVEELVNEWLRMNIQLIQSVQPRSEAGDSQALGCEFKSRLRH